MKRITPQNFITFLCSGDTEYTRKRSKVEPSDGHIFTTKKDNKILWSNSLPLLSWPARENKTLIEETEKNKKLCG